VVVLFEGRDAAGKGGVISRIASAMSPRICRVVALSAPSDRERSQWYFQRYTSHLPAAGEIVLFDRSWYNRAGVERVMGFCSDEEYEAFMEDVPNFERMLVRHGKIVLVKYWLDVSDHEQEIRFAGRLHRSWKRWKLSPMDLFARSRWTEYARARDDMLSRTNHPDGPWFVVPSDNKKAARLNCISDLLARIPYEDIHPAPLALPPRDSADTHPENDYVKPSSALWNYVLPLYDGDLLSVNDKLGCGPEGDAGGAGSPVSAECSLDAQDFQMDEDDDDAFFAHAGDA
jgi:polyphosphate kinase 2